MNVGYIYFNIPVRFSKFQENINSVAVSRISTIEPVTLLTNKSIDARAKTLLRIDQDIFQRVKFTQ